MGKCKCKICGKELDTRTAYLKANGPIRSYYCSKEEFEAGIDAYKKKKAEEDKVYRLVCDLLEEKEVVSPTLKTEWIEWNKVANNVKIANFLETKNEYLSKAMRRIKEQGSALQSRIKYLSAIIKNDISSFKSTKDPIIVSDYSSYTIVEKVPERKKKRSVEEMLADYEQLMD